MKKIILILILTIFISGCSTIEFFKRSPATAEFAVKAVTSRILTEKPEWKYKIVYVTDISIEALDDGLVTNFKNLQSFIAEDIEWEKLTVEEKDFIFFLVERINTRLYAYYEENNIDNWEEEKVVIKTLLKWINDVAKREY
jgi:uncharacterized protein YceK